MTPLAVPSSGDPGAHTDGTHFCPNDGTLTLAAIIPTVSVPSVARPGRDGDGPMTLPYI
jgi:hypothetical protein